MACLTLTREPKSNAMIPRKCPVIKRRRTWLRRPSSCRKSQIKLLKKFRPKNPWDSRSFLQCLLVITLRSQGASHCAREEKKGRRKDASPVSS